MKKILFFALIFFQFCSITNAAWISTNPKDLALIRGTSWQITDILGSWQFDFDPRIYYSDSGVPYIYAFDDAGGFYQTCYGANPFDTSQIGLLTIPAVPDEYASWMLYFNINGSSLSGTSYFKFITDSYYSETKETGTYIGKYTVPICPAKTALGNDTETLQALYDLRDTVLAKSAPGRMLIKTYYRSAPAITRALEASPLLREWTAKFLRIGTNMAQMLQTQNRVSFNELDYNR